MSTVLGDECSGADSVLSADWATDVIGKHAAFGGADRYMYTESFPGGMPVLDIPEIGMWVVVRGGMIMTTDPVA